jgi:hypothetical protein
LEHHAFLPTTWYQERNTGKGIRENTGTNREIPVKERNTGKREKDKSKLRWQECRTLAHLPPARHHRVKWLEAVATCWRPTILPWMLLLPQKTGKLWAMSVDAVAWLFFVLPKGALREQAITTRVKTACWEVMQHWVVPKSPLLWEGGEAIKPQTWDDGRTNIPGLDNGGM